MDLLGINLSSFLAQIFNFTILFIVLKKFVFNTVINLIKEERKRKLEIQKKQEAIEKEYENLDKKLANSLLKAEKKAEKIIESAKKTADEKKKEILVESKNEARKIQEQAQVAIAAEKEKMLLELEEKASNLAVKIASKLIVKFLDQDKQKIIITKSIQKLKNLNENQ